MLVVALNEDATLVCVWSLKTRFLTAGYALSIKKQLIWDEVVFMPIKNTFFATWSHCYGWYWWIYYQDLPAQNVKLKSDQCYHSRSMCFIPSSQYKIWRCSQIIRCLWLPSMKMLLWFVFDPEKHDFDCRLCFIH